MSFQTTCHVEFRDTDAAGIVHFSVFFNYMERAEHELLRSLGSSVVQRDENGQTISWPRVAATCDYRGTARFEETLDVHVVVEHLGTKSVRYRFEFLRDGGRVASGTLTAVCCRVDAEGHLESRPIPEELRRQLQQYVQ